MLVSPAEKATVPVRGLVTRWKPVSQTITGESVRIIAYQLIIERDVEPHPHMIGKLGLSIYVPALVTSIAVPNGFLQPRRVHVGGAGDRAERQPDALVRHVPDAVRVGRTDTRRSGGNEPS